MTKFFQREFRELIIVERIVFALIIVYLLITCYFFINWLIFSKQINSSSVEDGFLSFVILVISTLLWPVAIPISAIEILKTRKVESSDVITLTLAMFVVMLVTALATLGV